MSDIDAVVVDSLKALEPERPIREADIRPIQFLVGNTINSEQKICHTARLCRRGDRMSGKILSDDSAPRQTVADYRTRACTEVWLP